MTPLESQLLAVATEAQRTILDAIARMPVSEFEGSGFDQAGMRDGLAIIKESLRYGELGVAFEHLDYMVSETAIALSPTSARILSEVAVALGLPPPHPPAKKDG